MAAARVCGLTLCLALFSACGGEKSPTAPTPPPTPSASLASSGQGSWASCLPFSGDCIWAGSLQNSGPGCATGTTVVVRLYQGDQQLGADIQVGAEGTSLSGRTIRPGEVLALRSLNYVSNSIVTRAESYRMFPTWTDVRCP
jgi:hypothetical protein